LLTLDEVAQRCRLSAKAVRSAIRRGELRGSKVCGRWRVAPSAFRDWIDASAAVPVPRVRPSLPSPRPGGGQRGSHDRLAAIEQAASR